MEKKELSLVYELIEPLQASEKPPLLLMLHGYGSNEQDLFSMAPMLNKKFLIISARAPLMLPFGGFAWYEIDFDNAGSKMNNVQQAKSSLEQLQDFIKEIQFTYNSDETYLMGFSQGAILSYALALNDPLSFKAVLALSGYILKDIIPEKYELAELKELEFLVTHGTQDPVLPIEWARQSVKVLEQLKIKHQYREYPMAHGINPECFDDIKKWLKERSMI